MAQFQIPTPQEVRDQWFAEAEAQFPDTDPRLEKSLIGTIGKALSLAIHGLYIYLSFISRQIFASTAEAEYLDLHGTQIGLDRLEATASSGNVNVTGSNGSVIPIGTQLTSGDGNTYSATAEVTISGGVGVLAVESDTFGASTNQNVGVSLTFITPPVGINSTGLVATGGLTGGADRESDESYRARIRYRKQNPIQCGTSSDYIQWAKEVPQVTRAFVFPNELGAGTVVVRFMTDGATVNGIPTAPKVTEVYDYISSIMPVNVILTVQAPVAVPTNITLKVSPFTQAVQDAVLAELQDLFIRDAVAGGSILISRLREAVSNATGEIDNVVLSPTADITVGSNSNILTLGTVSQSAL